MSASMNFRPKTNLNVWVIYGNRMWAEKVYFFRFSSFQSEPTFKYKLQLEQQSLEEPPTYLSNSEVSRKHHFIWAHQSSKLT
jgi:hypothetical protein